MLRTALSRAVRASGAQKRLASTFNNPPRKIVKPFGLSGNTMLAIGFSFVTFAIICVQKSGYLIPHNIGPGLSPVGRIELDLTPDALKE